MSAGIKVTAPAAVIKTKANDLRYLYKGAVAPVDAFDEKSLEQVRDAGLVVDVEIVTVEELEQLEAQRAADAAAEAQAEAEAKAKADAAAAAAAKAKADADAKAKADAAAAKAKADAAAAAKA